MSGKIATGALTAAVLSALCLHAAPVAAADIGFCRAEQIAAEKVKGVVEEMERSAKKGKPVYKVDVRTPDGTSFEVTLDASSGEVLKVEQDD